ncbi:addiction module protein [Paraglaciecola sp. 20A4]|uniref:addiction module protein n=1 Tax=Paraglaciecola sp. 20A4 TaxID=2687288 RepID=UPI003211F73E
MEQLSTKEKALAAHCLTAAMDSAAEDDVETQWLKLAEARSAELESGKVEGISWRDINQDLT